MFSNNYRGCALCWWLTSPLAKGPNSPCWTCDLECKHFTLDKKKLDEEVQCGLRTRRQAERIIKQEKLRDGIPGQLRLTEGDDI